MKKRKKILKIAALGILALAIMLILSPVFFVKAANTTAKNHEINIVIHSGGTEMKCYWAWVKDSEYTGEGDSVNDGKKPSGTGPSWTQEDIIIDGDSFKFKGDVRNYTPFIYIEVTPAQGFQMVGVEAIEDGETNKQDLSFVRYGNGYLVDVGCYKGNWKTQTQANRVFRKANSTIQIYAKMEPIPNPKITVDGNGGTVVWDHTRALLNGEKAFYISKNEAYYYKTYNSTDNTIEHWSFDWDNVDDTDYMPFTATREGYALKGFYTAKTGGTLVLKDYEVQLNNAAISSDITIYAQWEATTDYTIKFDANGGTGSVPSTITKTGTGSNTIMGDIGSQVPTRPGYTFKGWSASSTYSNKRIAYLSSDAYGGSADRSGVSATTTQSSWSIATYVSNTGGDHSSKTLTLYAQWEPNQYTVAYNANGGTGTMSNSIATYNSNFITRQNAFSRIGYTFNGWNEYADGTHPEKWGLTNSGVYESGKYWKWTYTKSITLYAQWSPNVYTITLDNQSATSAGTTAYYEKYNTGNYKESSCSNNITSITIPQKTGYKFLGYYTGTNGTGTQYVDASGKILSTSTTFTSNVTLYAKWEKTIATIYYNANGGVVTTDKGYIIDNDGFLMLKDSNGNYVKAWKKVLYDDIDPVNVHNIHGTFGVSKVGYHSKVGAEYLVGSPTSSITIDNESTPLSFFQSYITNQDADILLYANWEANTYTINYYNGSTFLGYDNYTYDQAQDLKDFGILGGTIANSEYGWEFAGWSTSPNSTTITYTNKQNIKNITSANNDVINLYAVYKRDITFKNGINGVTTNTVTQYWNPYGTINGTHISSVKSPTLTTIANWTALGYRNDTIATLSKQAANSNIYPPINESNIYYGVYSRIITFKSGVNASVTDKTETQYLNSYNNVVSSITSGTPSNIANWTILGYRDDSTIGDKEYAINTVISPSYNTDNTFYAAYNRTLVITYDGNNNPHLSITGSVSDTTKVVYLNAYSTNTSSQEVTLRPNGFTYVGFDFVRWDIGGANKTYNPKLSYNHSTFKITAKAQWKHNDTGIGTIITPTLKVNNPNMSGIYYNDGIYFVKGDGKTAIELYGEATLNPSVLSRLDKISLNYVDNVLVQNPTYKEKYSLSIPKEDIWNFVYNKSNVIKYNEYTKDFVTLGEPIIVDFKQDKLSFTQKFTMTGKILVEPYVSSKASCVVKHEDGTDTIHDLYAYGNSLRLHSDPYKPSTYILNESGAKVEINSYDNKWTNESNITIVLEDEDSGIKYYKLIQNNIVIKEATNNAYTTQNTISLNLLESSTSYTLYIVDNVGNETTYTFTTNVDRVAPGIEDLVTTQGRDNVYTGNANKDAWPITSKSTTWEYNWEVLKALKYKVIDDKAGLKLVKITHYGQDSTYTNIWKSVTLVDINENKLNLGKETIIEEFNGDTHFVDGKNYLLIEVEDVVGNKTSVKLVIRRDKSPSKITNFKVTPVSLDKYTIDELNNLFSKGDMSKFKTNVKFNISDYISTDDTSGVKKVEIIVKDSKGAIIKRYDVTNNVSISDYTSETNNGNGKFSPLVRPISGSINVNIDTLGEFPKYSDLKVCVEVTDYVDNKTTSNDVLITNYAIKSVIYATKDNAYNIGSTNNVTNTPYFKTGEVGFVEVWSVGYVDKLELDFSNGNIGQEMNDMISQGLISPKYILGVHGGLPSQVRFLSDLSAYKVSTSYPDVDGVSFATHINYSFSDVNNSMGTSGVDGWDTKGTMIRIPTNHELVALNKLDRYGNQLYKWETHLANVYPYKNDIQGTPSSSCYTIWDNSMDDLHFRIIHQIFKR